MSTTAGLLAGIGALVNTAGFAVYDPDRTWTDSDTDVALFAGNLPETPSKVIGMLPYTVSDDPKLTDSVVRVQFRIRGDADPASVYPLNDALFACLQGLHDTTVGDTPIALSRRINSVPGQPDKNERAIHVASFEFLTAWPSTHRED